MHRSVLIALCCGSLSLAASAAAALEVRESVEVKAAPAAAWAAIEDFCSIKDWHPVIGQCEQFEEQGELRRRLTTKDGGVLLERRTANDPAAMSMSYEILESPLPVANYQSTMQVSPQGEGAVITWSSSFEAKDAPDDKAVEVMTGIYKLGLESLQAKLAK